jgi:hypothetical protein
VLLVYRALGRVLIVGLVDLRVGFFVFGLVLWLFVLGFRLGQVDVNLFGVTVSHLGDLFTGLPLPIFGWGLVFVVDGFDVCGFWFFGGFGGGQTGDDDEDKRNEELEEGYRGYSLNFHYLMSFFNSPFCT